MQIYSKNNRAKFHPDSIWDDGALDFLKTVAPTRTRWVVIWYEFLIQLSIVSAAVHRFNIIEITVIWDEVVVGMVTWHTGARLLVAVVDVNSAFNCRTVLHSSAFLHIMHQSINQYQVHCRMWANRWHKFILFLFSIIYSI